MAPGIARQRELAHPLSSNARSDAPDGESVCGEAGNVLDFVVGPQVANAVVGGFVSDVEPELAGAADLFPLPERRSVTIPLRGRFDILPESVAHAVGAVAARDGFACDGLGSRDVPLPPTVIAFQFDFEAFHVSRSSGHSIAGSSCPC